MLEANESVLILAGPSRRVPGQQRTERIGSCKAQECGFELFAQGVRKENDIDILKLLSCPGRLLSWLEHPPAH